MITCNIREMNEKLEVIAHRGGASLGPENTLDCIRQGILAGADAIEIDVHLSADGALVVCHDETLDRTTDMHGRIEDLTLSRIKTASISHVNGTERIPTLEEVLYEVKGKCRVLLEIKKSREGQYPQIEDKVVALIDTLGMKDQIVIQSFNDSVLKKLHAIAPEIPLEKLLVCRLPFGLAYDTALHKFSLDDYPYVQSFNTFNMFTTDRFIAEAHKIGKQVKVWTVDNPLKVKKGADGVITNCPQRFREG